MLIHAKILKGLIMKIHTLHYSCLLNASQERVCQFHTDTHNLPLITPPWINVTVVSMEDPMVEKSVVVLDIVRFGVSTRWEMQIQLQCPTMITDSMVKGPFAFFRHQRHFVAKTPQTTLMEETITLTLPFGWLGSLAFGWVKKDMDAMFEYRHNATQAYFLRVH